MDDPSLADLTGANLYNRDTGLYQGYESTGNESPIVAALRAKLNPEQMRNLVSGNIGPGGRSPEGYGLAWTPYDPNQKLFDSHQHFGGTYDDPVYGKLQSSWKEPSKAKADRDRASMMAFAAAVSAISMGAAAPLLAPAFSAVTKYGMGGGIDPAQLAISLGLSYLPTGLGGIDPGLAQGYRTASQAYGIGKAGYDASRGNYGPAAGIGLNELTRTLG